MNTIQRFFRRYIFSTVGIVLLFLFVNIALIFTILVVGSMSNSDVVFSVRQFSDHITKQGGYWTADDTALSMLQEKSAWAMVLSENGDVVWQQDMPKHLPKSYTSTEIASFSRWYLDGYPVKVWTRADGCLTVVGFQPGTLVKFYYALEWPYIGMLFTGGIAVFLINLFLILFLLLRNTRKVEKAMTPILQGIQDLSHGRPNRLQEQGELAEINAGLNRAADYMRKKGQHQSRMDPGRLPRHSHTALHGPRLRQRAGRQPCPPDGSQKAGGNHPPGKRKNETAD